MRLCEAEQQILGAILDFDILILHNDNLWLLAYAWKISKRVHTFVVWDIILHLFNPYHLHLTHRTGNCCEKGADQIHPIKETRQSQAHGRNRVSKYFTCEPVWLFLCLDIINMTCWNRSRREFLPLCWSGTFTWFQPTLYPRYRHDTILSLFCES